MQYIITSRGEAFVQNINVNNYTFEQVQQLKYLGLVLTSKNDIREEIKKKPATLHLTSNHSITCILWMQRLVSSHQVKGLRYLDQKQVQKDMIKMRNGDVDYMLLYNHKLYSSLNTLTVTNPQRL